MKKKRILLTGIAGIISAIALLPMFITPVKTEAFTLRHPTADGSGGVLSFSLTDGYTSQKMPFDIWFMFRPNTSYRISFTLTNLFNNDWLFDTGIALVRVYYTDGTLEALWGGAFFGDALPYGSVLPKGGIILCSYVTDSSKTFKNFDMFRLPNMNVDISNITVSPVTGDYQTGYSAGYNEGKTNADAEKYSDGYAEGYKYGQSTRSVADYSNGYADGQAESNVIIGFFPKIFGAVGSFFVDTLGGITLFGISLWQIVVTMVGLILIIFMLKFVT